LPDFSTAGGEPTGALYGVATMLLGIIETLKPDYIVATYDLPKPTHRHEAYKEYKAGRAKTDDALVAQIIRSRDIFKVLGIPMYDKEGFEADDILGTIVEKTVAERAAGELEVIIASGDMDTLQLVSGETVKVYTLKKGIKDTIIYDEPAVRERFGFGPELLPDYKGLRGDPSDNIIGIKGIGEKTATILINTFGTVEHMYEVLRGEGGDGAFKDVGITPRVIELLRAGEEDAEFSKVLATIRRDAPIDWKLPTVGWREAIDLDASSKLFADLEFRTMSGRLKNVIDGKVAPKRAPAPAADVEGGAGADLGASGTSDSPDVEAIAAKLEKDVPPARLREAALMLWLINSNISDPKLADILSFSKAQGFDAAYDILSAELGKRGLAKVYEEIEKPLIPVLDAMREVGVKIDGAFLQALGDEYRAVLAGLEKSIWKLAGMEFNIASPKQLGEVLFVKLGLKSKKKTAGGALSTKESELEKLEEEHPIIGDILKYRELAKLLGTYIETIPVLLDANSRIHPTSIQTGAVTGRMATKDPSIQNIPNRTELGRKIRNAFIAEKGWRLVAFDYSQIELRIAAFLSKDEKFIDIFRRGEDVHAAVAAQVFGVPVESVTKAMRSQAKVINFGVMYGMGVTALQKNLGTDRKNAQKFYNDYFEKFHGLAAYLEGVKAETARTGYTETFFGRRRYFDGIKSKVPFIRAAAERMAINAPIQGTEADIVKLAMVRVDEYVREKGLVDSVHMLMQVHDEIVLEVRDEVIEKIVPDIKAILEGIIPPADIHGIVCVADAKVGDSWGDMNKI
jgi:DNA polymerase-1